MDFKLHVWGERACFTRPELKVERVSYPAITPSAARGILEAIYWSPAIAWQVENIQVLRPIRFAAMRRNEVAARISAANVRDAIVRGSTQDLGISIEKHRQQRSTLYLVDVAYVIGARMNFEDARMAPGAEAKHAAIFERRARKGQCFHRPYLGLREFHAEFALVGDTWPEDLLTERDAQLGWMLHDIDYAHDANAVFFRAAMHDGRIDVPPMATTPGARHVAP